MNVRVISANVGRALLISALFMFLSMMVSVINGMDSAFGALSISFVITFLVGAFPFIFVKNTSSISLQEGFVIIVLSWFLSFIFGMLPYVLWGGEFSLVNAWFESVSGYTTTGSTILNDIEALPKSLLFWRSSTHFIGGLGVVVFVLLIMPSASPFRFKLTNIEQSSLSREGYRYRSGRMVYVIVSVYVGLAVLETICLCLAGMSFFDAVNHSFSTVATGGFSTKNMSVSYFDSVAINIILMVFMVLSSLHFGILFSVLATRSLKPMRNPTLRFFIGGIVVMSLLLTLSFKFQMGYSSWGKAAMDASFQVCSYVTTTGFGLSDNSELPLFAMLILAYAFFQCGCSGSTSGGVKADRLYILFKSVEYQIRKCVHPSSVGQIRIGNHPLKEDAVSHILIFICLYILLAFISSILLSLCGVCLSDAVSGSLASIGNVGPGFCGLGVFGNYSTQPLMAKIIYTVDMFLGRVEIYPVFVVFSLMFKKER